MTTILEDNELCDVCGATGSFTPLLAVNMRGKFDTHICRCERCGFRQLRPRTTQHEADMLYGQEYFDPEGATGYRDYAKQQQRYERMAFFLAKRLRRIAERGRLLEVGCALGFLLDGVKRMTSWDVEGLDIEPFAAEYARKVYDLDVKCATLEQAAYPDGRFDFVIQKDVLEHVLRPRDHLVETCRIVRPGGFVWLVTPNGEANIRPTLRIAASRGGPPPRLDSGHLSFFTRKNLLRLTSECGFDCVRFRNVGLKRGLRALGYLPEKRRRRRGPPASEPPAAAESEASPAPERTPEDRDRALERTRAGVEACRRRMRSWRAYYYYRQLFKLAGTLPGPLTVGLDFDVILRKRG